MARVISGNVNAEGGSHDRGQTDIRTHKHKTAHEDEISDEYSKLKIHADAYPRCMCEGVVIIACIEAYRQQREREKRDASASTNIGSKKLNETYSLYFILYFAPTSILD